MAGQTINDRLLAARHSIAGQGLAKSVCKATTEEMIGPKKKHLDYLVQCTNEPNVSIPQLANLLVERSQNANWIVVYKALITVHHMMCYGNERFTQFLASSNSTFQLSNYLDKSGLQGVAGAKTGYDMSPFVRRYARYLNEKALSYRTVAFDFCKIKRGKEDGTLRTMNAEKLLKTLPTLQNQLDALLEFDCTANNLNNGVINMCFMLLFRDLIRLFACYNDGVINLLEKYFDMNKKQCRDALDLYKRFLIRMDKVAEFLKVAENVGIDKGDIPDLTKAPSSLLDALEQHLLAIEGKKSNTTTPTQSANNQRNIRSGVTALSSTSTAFGTAASNGRLEGTNGIDESLKQQVLAEEEAAMNQYKSKVNSPNSATNPFLSSLANAAPVPAVDLFGPPVRQEPSSVKASDDLLQLSNPFADVFAQPAPVSNAPIQQNIWLTNGNGFAPQPAPQQTNTTFVSESNFSSVFGATDLTAANDLNVSGSPALNPFLTDISSEEAPPPFFLEDDDYLSPEAPTQTQQPMFDVFASTINEPTFKLDSILPLTQTTPNIPSEQQQYQKINTPTGTIQPVNNQNDVMMFDMAEDTNPKIDTKSVMTPRDSSLSMNTAMAAFDSNVTNEMARRDRESDTFMATETVVSPVSNLTAETVMAASNLTNEAGMAERKIVPPPRPPPPVVKQAQPPAKSALLDDLNTQSFMMALGSPEFDNTMAGSLLGDQPSVLEAALQPQTCLQDNMPFAGFDGLGGVLLPASSQGSVISNNSKSAQAQSSALLTGDLESSLASLAENLSINSRPVTVKGVQWNSPKNGAKPGASWTPQPMAATTGAGYRPMGQGMPNLSQQPMFPSIQPMGIRPMSTGQGIMTPMTGMGPSPATNPPMAQQQSLLFH